MRCSEYVNPGSLKMKRFKCSSNVAHHVLMCVSHTAQCVSVSLTEPPLSGSCRLMFHALADVVCVGCLCDAGGCFDAKGKTDLS